MVVLLSGVRARLGAAARSSALGDGPHVLLVLPDDAARGERQPLRVTAALDVGEGIRLLPGREAKRLPARKDQPHRPAREVLQPYGHRGPPMAPWELLAKSARSSHTRQRACELFSGALHCEPERFSVAQRSGQTE